MGCRPRARSVPHCHGVLALRHRPWTRAVPDESHLQDAASNLEAGSAGRQVKARFEASCEAVQKVPTYVIIENLVVVGEKWMKSDIRNHTLRASRASNYEQRPG